MLNVRVNEIEVSEHNVPF